MKRFSIFIVLFLTPFILNAVISPVTPDLLEDPSPRQELPSSNKSLEMNVIEPDLEQSALKIKLSIKNTGDSIFGYGEFFYVEKKVDESGICSHWMTRYSKISLPLTTMVKRYHPMKPEQSKFLCPTIL